MTESTLVRRTCLWCGEMYEEKRFGPGEAMVLGDPHSHFDCIIALRRQIEGLSMEVESLKTMLTEKGMTRT